MAQVRDSGMRSGEEWGRDFGEDDVNTFRLIFVGATFLSLPAEAQEHRFEDDPIMTVRENFVACDVLSQLQRVMADSRFLLAGEWEPPRAM